MNIKYFKVDFDLKKINRIIRRFCDKQSYQDLKFYEENQFLETFVEAIHGECEQNIFWETWRFHLLPDFKVIKVEISEVTKNLNEEFDEFLNMLKNEGINLGAFLGLVGCWTFVNGKQKALPSIGHDWKYKEITGAELLFLKKKEFKENSFKN